MVMIDLGHEKKSLGVISVTQAAGALLSNAPQVGDPWTYQQVTGPGIERRSASSRAKADAKR
jgi:hypothetical protein